jgi:hypothetical protein
MVMQSGIGQQIGGAPQRWSYLRLAGVLALSDSRVMDEVGRSSQSGTPPVTGTVSL